MSEQDDAKSSTKQRRSRKTNTANQQNGRQAPAAQHPVNDDTEAWEAYWREQDQPWRTEPEIGGERQKYLAERRAIVPDIEKGIYPFKDITLSRADVEWLLATHEAGLGSAMQMVAAHARGLDLQGADLRGVNLNRLPLVQIRGGLGSAEWRKATNEQREAAAVHLQGADLNRADLTWASLRSAHLEGVNLRYARLEGVTLRATKLGGNASFPPADLPTGCATRELRRDCLVLHKLFVSIVLLRILWVTS